MNHIMLDLETLGTVPGCVILSIGAVEFFPETCTLGAEFYTIINTASCEQHYLITDPDTVGWWSKQAPEARLVVDECAVGGPTLPVALEAYNRWLAELGAAKDIREYGNGADFDNPILRVAFDAGKVKPYAKGYGGRCYRTLKNLDELFGPGWEAPKMHRSGVHHNALDDAKSQAIHLMNYISQVKAAFLNQGVK